MRFLQWKTRGAHNRETHKGIVTETTMSQTEERGILPAQTPARELFAKTRLEGRYVDKTHALEKHLRAPADATVYTCPDRFGKSMFLSMFAQFLDITKDSRKLFEGLKVSANRELCQKWMNQCPVLFLSLKDETSTSLEEALQNIRNNISYACREHSYLLESPDLDCMDREDMEAFIAGTADSDLVQSALLVLTRILHSHHGKMPVVLVDDCDSPVARAAEYGYYDEMADFLDGFFCEGLKTNFDLKFSLLAGRVHIPTRSLTSGFNNASVYEVTEDGWCADFFAFTEEEVDTLLCDAGFSDKRDAFRAWYGGYRLDDRRDLYCPFGVMRHLAELKKDTLAHPGIFWQDRIAELIRRLPLERHIWMADNATDLLSGEAIVENFWRRPGYDPANCRSDDVWHLLYKAGCVTRDPEQRGEPSFGYWGERVPLVIPNREIRELFLFLFGAWFGKIVGKEQEEAFFAAFWQADSEGLKRVLEALVRESKESSKDCAAGKASLSTLSRGLLLGFFLLAFPETLSRKGMGRDVFRILDYRGGVCRGAVVKISRASGIEKLAALAAEGFTQIREGECEAGFFAEQKVETVVYASIAYREQGCEVRAALVKRT